MLYVYKYVCCMCVVCLHMFQRVYGALVQVEPCRQHRMRPSPRLRYCNVLVSDHLLPFYPPPSLALGALPFSPTSPQPTAASIPNFLMMFETWRAQSLALLYRAQALSGAYLKNCCLRLSLNRCHVHMHCWVAGCLKKCLLVRCMQRV